MFLILITILSFAYSPCIASQLVEGTLVTIPSEIGSPDINDLEIYSDCALLMERSTGNVLYDKNGNNRMYPASITKILTAILVLENCSLMEKAEVTSLALKAVPDSYVTCDIKIGEKFKVEDLLYAMLVPSANDAANVLAIHVSGSITGFADLMNQKSKEIGCTSSHFTNPSGIHDENHYSTARDLSLIADYAMNNETFRKIVMTTTTSLPSTEIYPYSDRVFTTSNNLILPEDNYYYEFATGIKTGYTNSSKDCIVASAKKDSIEYIVVILGGAQTQNGLRQKYLDCKTLFDFAFDNYTTYYKNLQAKKNTKFNPFARFFNNHSEQNVESNINMPSEIAVAAEPVEIENEETLKNTNGEFSIFSWIIIIFAIFCLAKISVTIVYIFAKKKRSKKLRNMRRKGKYGKRKKR